MKINAENERGGDAGGDRAWPPGHELGKPCKCKKLRYIQPNRTMSFRPISMFRKPSVAMADGTTYKLSYEPLDGETFRNCKGVPKLAKENLVSAGDMSCKTTHKMSYGPWPGLTRQTPTYPRDHRLIGEGPMSELTTQKHDYTPKMNESNPPIPRPDNIGHSNKPMEKDSTMSMSYQCPDYDRFEPATSFKPYPLFKPPDGPMDGNTTQKLSYMPYEKIAKEDYPWMRKQRYTKPLASMADSTVYGGSYLAPGNFADIECDCGDKGCYCSYPGECFDKGGETTQDYSQICPPGYNPPRACL